MNKLLVAALGTFLSSHVWAKSQIVSEFELVLPRQFQESLINKKWESLATEKFTEKWQFPDQEVLTNDQIPVKIKDISLNIDSQLQKPSLHAGQTVVKLSSKNLAATLRLGEVSVDHVIEKEVGGIYARIRVQALCRNVVLKLKQNEGELAISLAPQVGGTQFGAQVHDVDLAWRPGSWVWSPDLAECSGLSDFAELLKAEIDQIADDSRAFVEPKKELIRDLVQKYLDEVKVDLSGSHQLVVSRPDVKVMLVVDQYQDMGSLGARARGKITIDFLRDEKGTVKTLSLSSESAPSATGAQLRLPKDFVKEVLSKAYSANSWHHVVPSSDIPGFSSLMGSRFIQFFVWPELMKFAKESEFKFDLYSDKNMTITGEGMNYRVQGAFYSRMLAPKNGEHVNFMHFNMPLDASVRLSVSEGKAQATFAKPLIGLQAGWYASYLQQGRVSKSFSTRTILSRIIGALSGQTVSMDIPQLRIAEGLSLKVKGVSTTPSKDFVLNLAP